MDAIAELELGREFYATSEWRKAFESLSSVDRASGWFSRGNRLLEGVDEDCVERGYLLIPVWLGQMGNGDYEAAQTTTAEAAEIGKPSHRRRVHPLRAAVTHCRLCRWIASYGAKYVIHPACRGCAISSRSSPSRGCGSRSSELMYSCVARISPSE